MKYLNIALAAILLPLVAFAAGDANLMKYQQINPPATGPLTGEFIDIAAYKGNATFLVDVGASTDGAFTNVVTIKHCATTNGTFLTATNINGEAGVITITGVADGSLNTFACSLDRLNKYVRADVVQTNEAVAVGVVLVAPMKSE